MAQGINFVWETWDCISLPQLTYQFRQVVSISCSVKSIGNVIDVDQLTVKSIYNLCINFIIKRLGKLAETGDTKRAKGGREAGGVVD